MKNFLSILLALLPMSIFAQFEAAPVVTARVYIAEVDGNQGATRSCMDLIEAKIAKTISGGRITVTTDEDDADYAVRAHVISENRTSKTTTNKEKTKTTTKYTTKINYSIEVISMSDNSVVFTNTFDESSTNEDAEKSREDAEAKCGEAHYLINAICPLRGDIVDIEKLDKKGKKVESLYINIGEMHRIAQGDWFEVCVPNMVGGREVLKVIGKVEVEEIQGDDVSLCKVKRSGDKIKMSLDAGETLTVRSCEKELRILGITL